MPELPEVQTTVNGINKLPKGLVIKDVWTDYGGAFHVGKKNIKDKAYSEFFKREVIGATLKKADRRGKNILIRLSNHKTILIHMKMTGHLMYGKYIFDGTSWKPESNNGPLADPFNRFIHLIFTLSNGNHLAFSDARKFAKVFVYETKSDEIHPDIAHLGPDPLSASFTYDVFKTTLKKRLNGKIKTVLMDQTIIAGIGNIYSDEILFRAGIHPETAVKKIPETILKKLFESIVPILEKGIDFGGDSTSDYRNIHGEPGAFHHKHNVYRRSQLKCLKPRCAGTIKRLTVGGRSAHFCDTHQTLF